MEGVATFAALGLVLAACEGDGTDATGGTTDAGTDTDAGAGEAAAKIGGDEA